MSAERPWSWEGPDRTVCRKNDRDWPFPCACNACAAAAAREWVAYVESPAFVLGGPHPDFPRDTEETK